MGTKRLWLDAAAMARVRPWLLGTILGAGLAVGLTMAAAAVRAWEYAYPAQNVSVVELGDGFVEGGFIKVPFNVNRVRDCLANSTLLLTRTHDYGGVLGVREDLVVLGLYGTTVTDVGLHRVMLWFKYDPDLPKDDWTYAARTQDDCDRNPHPSRPVVLRRVRIP